MEVFQSPVSRNSLANSHHVSVQVQGDRCLSRIWQQHPWEATVLAVVRLAGRHEAGASDSWAQREMNVSTLSPSFYWIWNLSTFLCCSHLGLVFPAQPNLEAPSQQWSEKSVFMVSLSLLKLTMEVNHTEFPFLGYVTHACCTTYINS